MPVDTRNAKLLAAARAAIKAGDLTKAQNYLLMAEGEDAERLLDRVNKAIAARGTAPKAEAPQVTSKAVQGKGIRNRVVTIISVVIFVLVVIAGLIAFTLNQASPTLNVLGVCTGVIVSGRDCDISVILTQYPDAEANCKSRLGNWTKENEYDWQACMVDEGVVFEPAN